MVSHECSSNAAMAECGGGNGRRSTSSTIGRRQQLQHNNNRRGRSMHTSLATSNVVRVGPNKRRAHLTTILPITTTVTTTTNDTTAAATTTTTRRQRVPSDYRVYNEASAWLAWWHLQNPEQHILAGLRQRLQYCDIEFSLDMRDTRFSPIYAARELLRLVTNNDDDDDDNNNNNAKKNRHRRINNNNTATSPENNTNNFSRVAGEGDLTADDDSPAVGVGVGDVGVVSTKRPIALVGAARSDVSTTLSFLSSANHLPQVSSSSTAASLNNKGTHPLFGRTVPTNKGDAAAAALYLQRLGNKNGGGKERVVSHVAVLYIRDSFGMAYHADFAREAALRGITVASFSFEDSAVDDGTILNTIRQVKNSGMKYCVGIFNPRTWRPLVKLAAREKIMGQPGYTWLLTEASLEFTSPAFELDRVLENDLAQALHGTALVLVRVPRNEKFVSALQQFSNSTQQQQRFISQHREPDIFDNYTFPAPGTSLYQDLTYDALMALAIAACECEANDLFTGPELYEQLLKTEFLGVSGHVSFDESTGTRASSDLEISIENLFIDEERSTVSHYRFSAQTSAVINLREEKLWTLEPFIYADSTTTVPPALPLVDVDMNLIPLSVRVAGITAALFVMIASAGWIAWTLKYRKHRVVRMSQPLFLVQLCVGTLIMVSTVIPMSLQEPVSQRGLDIACMSVPWLASVGFVTAFSALFSKTWRLNKLFNTGASMRRFEVRAQHVVLPFIILMVINIGLLTAWTVISPLRWERRPKDNYDSFGRSVESYAICRSSSQTKLWAFVIPIAVVDLAALLFANFQSYRARKLPTDYSESTYIALSMASLTEAFVLGVPLIFLIKENPTTGYLIHSILIVITCLAIQLPLFLPKYVRRRKDERLGRGLGRRGMGRRSIHISIAAHNNTPRTSVSVTAARSSGARSNRSSGLARLSEDMNNTPPCTPPPSANNRTVGMIRGTSSRELAMGSIPTRVRRSSDYWHQITPVKENG